MNQKEMFKNALWVGADNRDYLDFKILRGDFYITSIEPAEIRAVGLGFCRIYVNETCLNPDSFLPLSSDYEAGADPEGEVLTHHRLYVPKFNITPYLKVGHNTVAIHYGGGWYTHIQRPFGLPKAIYCVTVGDEAFVSNENCTVGDSYITEYHLQQREFQDKTFFDSSCFGPEFDDFLWKSATVTEQLDTDYMFTSCPVDVITNEFEFKYIGEGDEGSVYDCGKNIAGYPVIKLEAPKGEKVTVKFSEDITENGSLEPSHMHRQEFSAVSDGKGLLAHTEFTWFGFRYIEVIGEAEPVCAKEIHSDVVVNSTFKSDNESLNWIYQTFIHTMISNLHTGHPSDCPHIERLGYTGDGQVTANAVMSVMDIKELYRKWMEDISDCQDRLSGNVQYTAPYVRCGGGPGGWGSAIIEVPYQFYKHYGETEILQRYYRQMKEYIRYMEEHTVGALVAYGQPGLWCLGDWCMPVVHTNHGVRHGFGTKEMQIILPPAFVNTYFLAKSLLRLSKIAAVIGKEKDIPLFKEKAEKYIEALRASYFDIFGKNYIGGLQGANAFMTDLGKEPDTVYKNLVEYYRSLGYFDTGIFGTDLVIKELFRGGEADLAVSLMTSDKGFSFERWRKTGATTFREYWQDKDCRSHSHHMFGAVVAYLFEYLLGITQSDDSAGYEKLIIKPAIVEQINNLSGSMQIPDGVVSVSYTKRFDSISFEVTLPKGKKATFIYDDEKRRLEPGLNKMIFRRIK